MKFSRVIVWLLVLVGAVSMAGCRPRGVMSRGELGDLLYDLHRADGILEVTGYSYGGEKNYREATRYYDAVLARHGVTRAQFDSTIVWYTDHPALFDKVYPGVLARLEADKEALDEEAKEARITSAKETAPEAVEDTTKVAIKDGPWLLWHKNDEKDEKNVLKFARIKNIL